MISSEWNLPATILKKTGLVKTGRQEPQSETFSRKNIYSDSWSSKATIDSHRVIMVCSLQWEEHSSRPFLCLFLILVSYFELVLSSPQMQIFKICLHIIWASVVINIVWNYWCCYWEQQRIPSGFDRIIGSICFRIVVSTAPQEAMRGRKAARKKYFWCILCNLLFPKHSWMGWIVLCCFNVHIIFLSHMSSVVILMIAYNLENRRCQKHSPCKGRRRFHLRWKLRILCWYIILIY